MRAREFIPQLATPRERADVAVGAGVTLIARRAGQEGGDRRLPGARGRRPGLRRPAGVLARRTSRSPPTPTPPRSTATSPATRTSRSALALLMGFVFPQNFDRPYRAAELPRLLAPLAHDALALPARLPLHPARRQPRRDAAQTARNLMITMVLGGLWHGAAWGFVLWGALHGAGPRGRARARASAARARPAWLRLVGRASTSSSSAGSCSARRDLASAGEFLSRLARPGRRRRSGRVPVVLRGARGVRRPAAAARLRSSALRAGSERRQPARSASGLASVIAVVGATVPSQGVPPFIYFQF